MSILDEYGQLATPEAPARKPRKRDVARDVEPWAGGAVAAAGRDKQAYEPWAGSGMKPAPASTAPAQVFGPSPGVPVVEGKTNPANLNAPGTRRNPDDRGFK